MAEFNGIGILKGVALVRGLILKCMNETEFKEEASEDYKNGFYAFGNGIISIIDEVIDEATKEGESE